MMTNLTQKRLKILRILDKPTNISKPTTVSKLFFTDHHTANDISLIPLELVHSHRDSVRQAREAYLITRDSTLQPLGLNKKDEMYIYYFVILFYICIFLFHYCNLYSIAFKFHPTKEKSLSSHSICTISYYKLFLFKL